jgi:hypothetical protein
VAGFTDFTTNKSAVPGVGVAVGVGELAVLLRAGRMAGRLLHPRNELTAPLMAKVGDESGPLALELLKRQVDCLRIELCVIEECQFAEPPELPAPIDEKTPEPVGDGHTDNPWTAARIENYGMKRV